MKKIIILLIILCLRSPSFGLAAGAFPSTIIIGGSPYIALNSLSQERGFEYLWDPLLKNATVRSRAGDVKFHVDSEYILSQGRLFRLSDRVRFFRDTVVVPSSAMEYLNRLNLEPSLALPATYVAAPLPGHRIRKIVIDPGHGGRDHGALSRRGNAEKELVLKVAKMIRDELRTQGIEVIMTRQTDVFVPLAARARIANKLGADFFVSIHANASTTRSLEGFEVYYLSEATDDAALALERAENSSLGLDTAQWAGPDKALKTIVWDLKEAENRKESVRIANYVADSVERSVVISKRRIKSAGFYVLKWTECPAVLVEMGYLTNREDEKMLRDPYYQRAMARAVAKGLMDYKAEFERTGGFTE